MSAVGRRFPMYPPRAHGYGPDRMGRRVRFMTMTPSRSRRPLAESPSAVAISLAAWDGLPLSDGLLLGRLVVHLDVVQR